MHQSSAIAVSVFTAALVLTGCNIPPASAGEKKSTNISADPVVAQSTPIELPGPDQARIQDFLLKQGYKDKDWGNQTGHLSGTFVDPTYYTAHGYIEVYYSPGIKEWLDTYPAKTRDALANNDMIVALEYAALAKTELAKSPELKHGELKRILSMVRWTGDDQRGGAHDGWFWSSISPPGADTKVSSGKFGDTRCLSCHVSADNESLVFLSGKPPADYGSQDWSPADLALPDSKPPKRQLIEKLDDDAPAVARFLKYFEVEPVTEAAFDEFPARKFDHVFAPWTRQTGQAEKHQNNFITSDQCSTCHDASQLYSGTKPNMWYPEPYPKTSLVDGNLDKETFRNFSPYGEWGASLNGLSGRDPVWHAQVEFERRLRPELAEFTTATCFSCHGPMAGRQLDIDGREEGFDIEMFYATEKRGQRGTRDQDTNIGPHSSADFAKYGALARDGVSCAVCHQISGDELGVDPDFDLDFPTKHLDPDQLKTYTAMFQVEKEATKNAYWGPYEEGKLTEGKVASAAMDKALGLRARHGPLLDEDSPFLHKKYPDLTNSPQIHESKLCGSCHTVIVPALRVGYGQEEKKSHLDKNGKPTENPFLDQQAKMSFEQTTYFEWRNSRYENEVNPKNRTAMTCQACHMASHRKHEEAPGFDNQRIVNVLSDRYPPASGRALGEAITYTKKDPIYRHVLLGINYFVFEMYEQFPELLGAVNNDPNVPGNTLDPLINARDWIENHAERITADVVITKMAQGDKNLEVEVEITNLAGHKFPTGAGFRRAFIQFEVLDKEGKPLWVSGRTSALGVLLDAQGETLNSEKTLVPWESQNHHQIITKQDQVQIYETRALNSERQLQTTVLGIYHEYKDNRILPNGWLPFDESEHGGERDHGPPKQNRNLEYSMHPLLVGMRSDQPKGVQIEDPHGKTCTETHHHPVLENVERDREGEYELPKEIRPPEIGEGVWGSDETEESYDSVYDADYFDPSTYVCDPDAKVGAQRGQDHVTYRIPLNEIGGWTKVRARLYYQTIPPYFLTDRFKKRQNESDGPLAHGPDLKRLAYMASHLNLDGTPAENWSLAIGKTAEATANDIGKRKRRTNIELENYVRDRLHKHYIYLDLPKQVDGGADCESTERKNP